MSDLLIEFARLSPLMVWAGVVTALTMAAAVIVERSAFGVQQTLSRRVTERYRPLVSVRSQETKRPEVSCCAVPRDIGLLSRAC